jgi:hypothetical protein
MDFLLEGGTLLSPDRIAWIEVSTRIYVWSNEEA